MFYCLSTLSLILLALGIWQRRYRNRHIPLMSSAFALDLGLVLVIEFQRHAIERIVAHKLSSFTLFHASISTMVLILYGLMAYLGYAIVKNQPNARKWHRRTGIIFVCFRLTNYVTSFFI